MYFQCYNSNWLDYPVKFGGELKNQNFQHSAEVQFSYFFAHFKEFIFRFSQRVYRGSKRGGGYSVYGKSAVTYYK